MISAGGSIQEYLETLELLMGLVERCSTVVPGHGAPINRDKARQVLAEDFEYIEALKDGREDVRLPDGRRTPAQQRIHTENLERVR